MILTQLYNRSVQILTIPNIHIGLDDVGFVRIDQRILVPEFGDIWLRVLQSFHDHPVSGHFGVNKTLSVI
jgi:hypothetical protein